MEQNYYEVDAVNQSLLTKLSYHPSLIKNTKEYKKTYSLDFGSLVDCLLTEKDKFDEIFYYNPNIKTPTGQMKDLVENYYDNYESGYTVDQIRKDNNLYSNLKEETFQKKFKEEGLPYFTCLEEANGRIIIKDEEMYNSAIKAADAIYNHPTLKEEIYDNPDVEILSQVEIYFDYKEVKCKAKLDLVTVNHKTKTIRPWDVKTTSDYPNAFLRSYLKYRYDLQGGFYENSLYSYKEQLTTIKDYIIQPFRFIVVNPEYPVYIYEMSPRDLYASQYGGVINGIKYKGYDELIEDYIWHKSNDKFDYEREVYESNLVKKIETYEPISK